MRLRGHIPGIADPSSHIFIATMDLSNLSSNLPATKSLEQVSLIEVTKDLAAEFKNAAKSVASLYNSTQKPPKVEFANAAKAVASLYRLGSGSTVLLRNKGYLDCLDDLLQMIANGDDIENWALTKRAEITNHYNKEHKEEEDFALPSEYEFTLPAELASNIAFRPSFAPLSVTYRAKKKMYKKKLVNQSSGSSEESDESDVEKKRKLRSANEQVKRRKKEASSDHD